MIKRHSYIYVLAAALLTISAVIYLVHYLVFRDVRHIFIYLVGDLAFLPLEVLIVVVIVERMMSRREKQTKLYKLNMVVGAFFSELGNYLLQSLLEHFNNKDEITSKLNVTATWIKRDFRKAAAFANNLPIDVNIRSLDLGHLKEFLSRRRTFLLTLLENPNLLEHDRFTDLLWAVTHLDEELEARESLTDLTERDLAHLAGDVSRMYDTLASEWLDYIEHLKSKYPYLFSLVLRTHPFQPNPSPLFP